MMLNSSAMREISSCPPTTISGGCSPAARRRAASSSILIGLARLVASQAESDTPIRVTKINTPVKIMSKWERISRYGFSGVPT